MTPYRALAVLLLLSCMGFTGCTIRVIDDTSDFDIEAEVNSTADGCDVYIRRVEARGTQQMKAEAK